MVLAAVVAGAGFAADQDRVYIAGIAGMLVFAAATWMVEITAPNPKDIVARVLPSPGDRARWDESALDAPWAQHTLCVACSGAKLCSSCGGSGGCDACAGKSWCAACGGAGQWPDDPAVAIYAPIPADSRPLD